MKLIGVIKTGHVNLHFVEFTELKDFIFVTCTYCHNQSLGLSIGVLCNNLLVVPSSVVFLPMHDFI